MPIIQIHIEQENYEIIKKLKGELTWKEMLLNFNPSNPLQILKKKALLLQAQDEKLKLEIEAYKEDYKNGNTE